MGVQHARYDKTLQLIARTMATEDVSFKRALRAVLQLFVTTYALMGQSDRERLQSITIRTIAQMANTAAAKKASANKRTATAKPLSALLPRTRKKR